MAIELTPIAAPPTCRTCRFSTPNHGANGEVLDGFRCQRYPPQLVFVAGPMESYPASVFPAVDADHWCGEWGKAS